MLPLLTLLAGGAWAAAAAGPTLQSLQIPGDPAFVKVAKDVVAVEFAIDPSLASGDGLFDDAGKAPSFSTSSVAALMARLDIDLEALKAMPRRSWDVDRQIDWRLILANAESARREISVENLFLHRPGAWLESLANDFINLLTYAPQRVDLRDALIRQIPGMVAEMKAVCAHPTARDVTTASGITDGLLAMLKAERPSAERDAAAESLNVYVAELKALKDLPEFAVIGKDNYAWRLRHALLVPWSAEQLLAMAQRELVDNAAAIAELEPKVSTTPVATAEQRRIAEKLTQPQLLALYDDIPRQDRDFLVKSDIVTIPAAVGPISARPTPDAMIPLTGDGGSMNPPPAIGKSNVGWWNVEHLKSDWTTRQKLDAVLSAQDFKVTDMGPYSAHEGVPGHHLQLSIARLNPDPLRSLLGDNTQCEGWALYSEEMFWQAGGLGPTPEARYQTLTSYRHRIRRVVWDVNVESGYWTLQDAGDFLSQTRRGQGTVNEDILRTINWPEQLIGYFTGKAQILELKQAYQRKLGAAYTDKRFHDAFLAEGSIPVALIRAKLLGEPVPE